MGFPQTRLTLIQRLTSIGGEEDWQIFLRDYWGPICRFSLRQGAQNLDDAEDVASETFVVLWKQRLLVRWASNRSAKLRTLLCSVARNILSHRNRVRKGRQRRLRGLAEDNKWMKRTTAHDVDVFFVTWVEDLIQRAVESLVAEYCRKGRVDYVRVLYGRLCRGRTIAETAEALEISPAAVDHYFRHARERLSAKLEQLARRQIQNYCPLEEAEQEFAAEWQRMGQYLTEHGGLDEAVRRAYDLLDPVRMKKYKTTGLTKAVTQLTSVIRATPDTTRSQNTS